jgi:hypothetical protein
MNIPVSVVWEIALVVLGFVFGTLWGHHAQIGKRVTYTECAEKRHNCPCTKAIDEIRGDINQLHPHKKG